MSLGVKGRSRYIGAGHSLPAPQAGLLGPYGSPQCVVVVDCITKRAKSRGGGGYIGWLLDCRDMGHFFLKMGMVGI